MTDLATALERVLQIAPRPRPLDKLRQFAEQIDEETYDVSDDRIAEAIQEESWAGPIHRVLQLVLARWDHEAIDAWVDTSLPNTADRRARIYDLLDLGPALRLVLDEKLPFYSAADPLLIIADRFEPWYTLDRRAGSTFYWDAFARFLEITNGWDPDDIISIDESTTAVAERISDPLRTEVYQAKGLVVGHVQSGKTANITGVVAKAADAGYRLVIVLSGTMNLLRAQTQRRIDRELIGKELIRPLAEVSDDEDLDYLLDEDWASFVEHGSRPSELGSFDWIRLTGEVDDYRRLRAGIETLSFERRDPSKPFYAAENLRAAKARIMVVKKNATVLRRVAQDLRQISGRLGEVPALVIDDESDLASINTARPPTAEEERKRTTINRRIVELLRQLPRAQYVGYTATPFANVFINPADAEDLFPKDFIISLPRPKQYMGASDFHDLEGPPPGSQSDPYRSNQRAFIRDVRGDNRDPANLERAIDCYVLAGALKLYRQVELPSDATRRDPFRHHTMLIHSSRLVADQEAMAEVARDTLQNAAYEGGRGMRRLQETFEQDLVPVSLSRGGRLPMPATFDRLLPFIGKALTFIWDGPSPVRVVNGEPGNDDPDFEKQRIWKILVGGAKLSRGYTVEGLTISYFRRTARAADTLMQMGRWFGFRELYHDLVRVFIGREEGHRGSYDIYEAFEGICRDEEAFREQLQRYAMPQDGGTPITPMQVPPLVASHLPWVPPTARNKMFNAQIRFQNLGGQWAESTVAPTDREPEKLAANQDLFRTILGSTKLETAQFAMDDWSFDAVVAVLSKSAGERVVREYQWSGENRPLQRHLEFMTATGSHDPDIHDWLMIAPQLKRGPAWDIGPRKLTIKYRARIGERVGVFTEPHHRAAATAIISPDTLSGASAAFEEFRASSRGVLLFYPVTHSDPIELEQTPTMGFALLFPLNNIASNIVFGVADPMLPDAPVVDAA